MQFYLDGFYTGDPAVVPVAEPPVVRSLEEQAQVDVLIVGTGPAGLVLAAQLAQFPGITTRIVERRAGRWNSDRPTGSPAARWRRSTRSG